MKTADEEKTLISALEIAARTFREMHPNATLLGSDPNNSVLDPLTAAIEACESYRAVAGHMTFSGGSGPVIHSSSLAAQLFSRGARYGDNFTEAVAWLLRILTTRKATMLFKSAVWGLSISYLAKLDRAQELRRA
jgi:hypothetical protein